MRRVSYEGRGTSGWKSINVWDRSQQETPVERRVANAVGLADRLEPLKVAKKGAAYQSELVQRGKYPRIYIPLIACEKGFSLGNMT